jgi:branched-chain amino acid transport system substrate-binding protein
MLSAQRLEGSSETNKPERQRGEEVMRVALMFAGAVVAAAVTVVTASGASAAEPKCGLSNGKAASGQPIEVGAVVGKTGPADFSGSAQAAAAYFACVNANGGINGRPIHYSVEDDQWNPETAAQVAAKLVNDTKVVGMVGNSSFVECAANAKFYETNNVLVIAGVGVPRDCFHSRNIAPTNGGPRMSNIGAAQYMHDELKVKRLVCIGPNIPNVGDWSCDGVAAYGKTVGLEVKTILVDPGSMDATSVILEAMSFKPDAIDFNTPKEMGIPLYAAAEQQQLGGKVIITAPTSHYDASVPKAIGPYWNMPGRVFIELELEPLDKKGGDVDNWHAVLDKYGKTSDQRNTFSQAGYLAAAAATDALLKMDPAKIDRASVAEAFRNIKDVKTDVSCVPWYFGPGDEHNAIHAGSVAEVVDGKFVTRKSCFQMFDADLAGILKMEKDLHLAD